MKKQRKIKSMRKQMIFFTMLIVLVFIVISSFILFKMGGAMCKSLPADEINIHGHYGIRSSNSVYLSISVKGTELTIPSDIGKEDNVLRPLHTDDNSGKITMESKCPRDFVLGDFFKIWKKNFNGTCILDYCNNGTRMVKMLVNGEENNNFENLVLVDGQKINIIYN
jgi:hypothetical protein